MRNVALLFIVCFGTIFFACKNKNAKEIEANSRVNNDNLPFYPINSFIANEIKTVTDSSYTIYKKIIVNQKRVDSSKINKDEFSALAKYFLQKDIAVMPLKSKYKESVFRDLTTNTSIMNYTTTDHTEEIQSIDIVVNQDNSIKRIDWRAFVNKSDSLFKENYSWIPGKRFNIIRSYQGDSSKNLLEETYVVWNDKK